MMTRISSWDTAFLTGRVVIVGRLDRRGVEVHAADPPWARERGTTVQHPAVIVDEDVAGADPEAELMARIAQDAPEAVVGPVPGGHPIVRDLKRRGREVRRPHLHAAVAEGHD